MSDYAREKFWQAVDCLATSARPIQKRLVSAAQSMIALKPEDFPDHLREEFVAMWQELTKHKAEGDEGTIEATMRRVTDAEAEKIADRILHIYTELHGGI